MSDRSYAVSTIMTKQRIVVRQKGKNENAHGPRLRPKVRVNICSLHQLPPQVKLLQLFEITFMKINFMRTSNLFDSLGNNVPFDLSKLEKQLV